MRGWGVGSQVKSLVAKQENFEFDPRHLHSGVGELIPASCPLTFPCALWHVLTHIQQTNKQANACS